jgi:hypothetical protein
MIDKIEIISVNYNTPDLVEEVIKSIRNTQGDYQIRIIDGSDREPYKQQVLDICAKYENILIEPQGWNIHHGRGMDLGLSTSKFDWCLTLDTDVHLKKLLIPFMLSAATINNKHLCGSYCHVNSAGIGISRYYSPQYPIKYYHPALCLWKVEEYLKLRNKGVKCIYHGAPNIQIMQYYYNNKVDVGIDIWEEMQIPDDKQYEYRNMNSRGTVNRFGYNL